MAYRGPSVKDARRRVHAETGGVAAGGDLEIHIHGVTEEPPEGEELGPCRKCFRQIWINAPRCPHCGYDPSVEAAIRQAALDRIDEQRAQEMAVRVLMCFAGALLSLFLVDIVGATGLFAFKLWLSLAGLLGLALIAVVENIEYLTEELLPACWAAGKRVTSNWLSEDRTR